MGMLKAAARKKLTDALSEVKEEVLQSLLPEVA
jgi:spore maturation protein SpmA